MSENKQICPLMTVGMKQRSGEISCCWKEKCAWWVEDKQKCAMAIKEGEE